MTHFREEQDYIDTGFQNTRVQEIDEGPVVYTAANLIFFGLGVNAERVRLFVADTWYDSLDGSQPVFHIEGVMLGVSGHRKQRSYPFFARRSEKSFSDFKTGVVDPHDAPLGPQTLISLGIDI